MGYSQTDVIVFYVAMGIACTLVLFGWSAIAGISAFLIRARVKKVTAGLPDEQTREPAQAKWALYLMSALMWPAALGLGFWLSMKPNTARAGAVCLYLFLAYITFSVLVAVGLVAGVSIFATDWMMAVMDL